MLLVFAFLLLLDTLPRNVGNKTVDAENFITNQFEIRVFRIINTDENNAILRKQFLQQLEPRIHHAKPLVVAAQILALCADNLPQPCLDMRIVDIVVVHPFFVSRVVRRINFLTVFDTIQNGLHAEKVQKIRAFRGSRFLRKPLSVYGIFS